jgi:hypothetical protein
MKRQEIERLAKNISIDRGVIDQERILSDAEAALEAVQTPHVRVPSRGRFPFLVCAGGLAAALLVVTSWVALDLRREVTDLREELALARQDITPAQPDNTTTINLYLKEHRDVVARHASFSASASQSAQIRVDQHEILYYEVFDDGPEYMHPGIIVRGPSSQREIVPSETPVISNGHILTLSEARKTAGFSLQAPPRLFPGHRLDKIMRIEGRDALHLSYTNGIGRISLFEQHLDAKRQLVAHDFREYAVYLNKGQGGGAILAWRDDTLSYVLIGNVEMSQLMDMAQSIGAEDER